MIKNPSKTPAYPLDPLVEVMLRLRAPDGCPWDKIQTNESLRRYLVEETYEVLEAIDEQEWCKVKEELGDVLLQVVFHAAIAAENDLFDINDVVETVTTKLIRRHPHIFGDGTAEDADAVMISWEKIKEQERKAMGQEYESVLDGVPKDLPALTQAEKIQEKAARVGFEWEHVSGALTKVQEELDEFQKAYQDDNHSNMVAEMGDVFFALVNVARYLEIDPEMSLREATHKFIRRFHFVEESAEGLGRDLTSMDLEEMDQLWDKAKLME
ncbi:MAG: nucleoside triphosphate pyrophosphohydrolase [Firmicutes bacterium]|nr:nucleoside triphosphate pyrophosphohydrolase [Bacillota bacterium]